jgi:aminomethyltransferase
MPATDPQSPPALRKTALNAVHISRGALLVDFGGWEMPLWYPSGAVREHLAVLTGAGLFDTSHMSVFLIRGREVRAFLNYALTRDIGALARDRAGYSLLLDASGCTVDDTIVYPLDQNRFALVVNAGMSGKVIAHLRDLPGGKGFAFTDLTGTCAKLDIQGPAAYRILCGHLAEAEALFAKFPYFSFRGDFDFASTPVRLTDGTPILLSRTGYTGEQGFEIFLPADRALSLWERLLEGGRADGLIPCGLAARDSLRAGAVLPLSHQDIGPWPFINTPWSFALPLDARGAFTKDFLGRSALDPAVADHTLPFAGFDPRKVETREARVFLGGAEMGTVLTAVADMSIGRVNGRLVGLASPDKPEGWRPRGLVCGFVKVRQSLPAGTIVQLKDARREIPVEIRADIRPGRTARKALQ